MWQDQSNSSPSLKGDQPAEAGGVGDRNEAGIVGAGRAEEALEPPGLVKATEPDPLAHLRHARRFVIIGQTLDGRRFRPSDWAERLAGVMSGYRPGRRGSLRPGAQSHLSYSPYVVPSNHEGYKCVIVDARLHDIEPLAHHFVLNFALDNGLRTAVLD